MSIYIQEVLGLLKRNKKKTTLERDRDYFEFGKLASTSRIDTSSSYIAQMEPFTIKYQDFFCDIRQDLTVTIANSGVEGKVPVYTVKDAICLSDALKDSIITQNSTDTLITITGALTVNEDSILSKNINLGISGDIVNKTSLFNVIHDSAGTAAGTANRILRSLADGRVVWSDDDPVVSLTYGSIWRGSAANVKEELAIGTAGQVLTSDGTTASWSASSVGVTGTGTAKNIAMWTAAGSIGNAAPLVMTNETLAAINTLTLGVDADADKVLFEATVEFQGYVKDAGANLGTAGQILIADSSSQVLWGDTVSSVSSTTDGTALQVSVTTATTTPAIAFTWQGASSEYVSGDGALVTFPAIPFTSLTTTGTSGAATLTSGVLNIPNYATGSGSGTVTDFSALVNGGVTDAISLRVFDSTTTPRLELDFDGVAGQYINGLGVLTTFPTITSGTVTTVSATTTGDALDVLVTNPTTAPDLQFTWSGLSTDYIDGQGNVKVFPASSAGTVTSVATTHSGNAFAATIGNVSTINPSVDITMQGDSSQYINGSGDLVTFPSIPTSYSWNLEGDTGTPEEIIDGENAKIGGGTGISTSTVAANTLSVGLDNTGVTAGNYSAADITVNSQGQITAASDGSAALGYLSYVAIWTNPKGQPITVTILSNDTGCQWNWELSASLAGEYTISPSVPGDPFTICDKAATHTTWVMANGQSTPVEGVAPAQIYFKNVTNQKVVIELLEESNIGSTKGVERGNIEIRLYNNIK